MWVSLTATISFAQTIFETTAGSIHFKSTASLEIIDATSNKMRGAVDINQNTFAFSVEITSFDGFNSALQKEHFNENYLESDLFPKATFSGKLIDKFDSTKSTQTLRAKGQLDIHGVKMERIVSVTLIKSGQNYAISSSFNIAVADHGITIPRIVNQKIAEIIMVEVKGTLKPKTAQ
jgi:polyisoprenoid-binding protein YceI